MHQASLSEAMTVLREESLRSHRELDVEQRESTVQLCSDIESLEVRVKEEIARCQREQDGKREAMQSSTLSAMKNSLADYDADLQEDLNRLAWDNDCPHDNITNKMNEGFKALDRKVDERTDCPLRRNESETKEVVSCSGLQPCAKTQGCNPRRGDEFPPLFVPSQQYLHTC